MEKNIRAALLRSARAMAGIEQADLAERAGVHRNAVHRAERDGPGPRVWPRLVEALAEAGVVIDEEARTVRLAG